MEDATVQKTVAKGKLNKKPDKRPNWSTIALLIGFATLIAFLLFDRNNEVSRLIQSYGTSGVIGAILIMSFLCATPFPSEGLLIMYLKVYGVFWGMLYALIGFSLGSLLLYAIARFLGNKAICSWILGDCRFKAIDSWIKRKGTEGLLMVRLLPIPAFVANMITGLLPSVSFWNYLWTGVVGIIPYYIGVSLIFLGILRQDFLSLLIGIPVLIFICFIGYRWHLR